MPRPSFHGPGTPAHAADEALRRPQTVLQQVFLDHLAEHGVSIAGGWELQQLAEDAEGVRAGVVDVDSGERRTVRAAYVLGTDGGSSTTRRLAGIDREGDHATEKRLRLIVRTGDISDRVGAAPSATNIVFNHRASGFLAAVSTREWRVYAGPYPLVYEPTEEELLAIGRAAFGFD
ncbi:monooxygenase, partial [Streptomyces sp. SID8455]|nr:monooxygenase [Streptomyces sp. SID8455]